MVPFVFEPDMGFERYVEYALDVPMYFVYRNSAYIDAAGQSFRDFLHRKLPALPGELPTLGDWSDHLTTLYPEVRMKRFLEMRGADGGPWQRICALPAFWVGLLYDSVALDEAYELVRYWSTEDLQQLRDEVPRSALKTPFKGRILKDVALEVLAISRRGLHRRAVLNTAGQNESIFLDTLFDIAQSNRTPAENLLEAYYTRWGENVEPVFSEYAY